MTFELNFCTDSAQTFPANWRMRASLKRLSFRSRIYWTTCQTISANFFKMTFIGFYIVAVWILNESQCIVRDLTHKLSALHLWSVINASLQDTTTMAMSSNFHTIIRDRIVNELESIRKITCMLRNPYYLIVFRSELVQAFLNDVVSVQVLDENNDVQA